jgi:lipopolysaccharide export LptBFGC system permease protein LptF
MTILDRYIARQFLFNTVALVLLLFAFVVTIDVALNLDRFVSTAERVTQGHDPSPVRLSLVTVFLIADLWWPRLLQLFNFLIGLVLAGAMGFTVTQLVRHREMVAVLASGVSLHRVARPVMLVAVGATLVQALNQELVIPRLAERGLLMREVRDAARHEISPFEVRLLRDARGNRYYASTFDKAAGTLQGLHVWLADDQGRLVERVSAPIARWTGPASGADGATARPAGAEGAGAWVLEGARRQPLRLAPPGAPSPSPLTPPASSAGGVAAGGGGGERLPDFPLRTDMDPTSLLIKRYASFSQSLSWSQISQMLRVADLDPAMRQQLERVRWGRLSLMISNLLALLITMPFFLTREPKNMVLQSLKCAPVGIVTMMGAVIVTAWSVPGLPAAFGAFLPVMVLVPIAIAVLSAMKT